MPNPISLLFYEFEEIPQVYFLVKICGEIDFKAYNLDSKNYRKLYFNALVMVSLLLIQCFIFLNELNKNFFFSL